MDGGNSQTGDRQNDPGIHACMRISALQDGRDSGMSWPCAPKQTGGGYVTSVGLISKRNPSGQQQACKPAARVQAQGQKARLPRAPHEGPLQQPEGTLCQYQ